MAKKRTDKTPVKLIDAPAKDKLRVVMALWKKHAKEPETVYHLMQLTAIVAEQYAEQEACHGKH